jgi:type II secretory pathway component PulJ
MADRMRDERGTTLVELMVGLAAGMVVLAALSMVLIVAVRTTSRIGARVDATQRARVVLTQITEELHSACIEPQMAPILSESNKTELVFVHAVSGTASSVAPTPVKSVIRLNGNTLEQKDTAWVKGTAPNWEWSAATPSTRKLLTKVSPGGLSGTLFTYKVYSNGVLESFAPAAPSTLGTTTAPKVVQVQLALNALPTSQPVKDPGSDATLQSTAVLRLTPPTFSESAPALPCQ